MPIVETLANCHEETCITYREWLPNAKQVFLIGEFNSWKNTVPLKSEAGSQASNCRCPPRPTRVQGGSMKGEIEAQS